MSPWPLSAGVLALGIISLVVWLIRRARRRRNDLERLLDRANEKLEQLQMRFNWFAPPDVVEHLSTPGGVIQPSRRMVTVLFADLIGFTTLCDRLDPSEVAPLLNGYFEHMSQAIRRHHGRITELIGDGLLALFGALESNPWQAQDAVRAALDMRKSLAEYNRELRAQGKPELKFGMGIHHGEVLTAVIGNRELSKFSVVGDTINVASRVERLTREHGVDLLITEQVRHSLNDQFRLKAMPPMVVKGKTEPIPTYWVEDLSDPT